MTVSASAPKLTALEILKQTRDLFAATHWTTGTLYTTDREGKKKFCMIGGLCHVFGSSEVPEWNPTKTFYPGSAFDHRNASGTLPRGISRDINLIEITKAEWELAKTIDPELPEDASGEKAESTIIDWNDQEAKEQFQIRLDASYVIETMDETIARVEAQETS